MLGDCKDSDRPSGGYDDDTFLTSLTSHPGTAVFPHVSRTRVKTQAPISHFRPSKTGADYTQS